MADGVGTSIRYHIGADAELRSFRELQGMLEKMRGSVRAQSAEYRSLTSQIDACAAAQRRLAATAAAVNKTAAVGLGPMLAGAGGTVRPGGSLGALARPPAWAQTGQGLSAAAIGTMSVGYMGSMKNMTNELVGYGRETEKVTGLKGALIRQMKAFQGQAGKMDGLKAIFTTIQHPIVILGVAIGYMVGKLKEANAEYEKLRDANNAVDAAKASMEDYWAVLKNATEAEKEWIKEVQRSAKEAKTAVEVQKELADQIDRATKLKEQEAELEAEIEKQRIDANENLTDSQKTQAKLDVDLRLKKRKRTLEEQKEQQDLFSLANAGYQSRQKAEMAGQALPAAAAAAKIAEDEKKVADGQLASVREEQEKIIKASVNKQRELEGGSDIRTAFEKVMGAAPASLAMRRERMIEEEKATQAEARGRINTAAVAAGKVGTTAQEAKDRHEYLRRTYDEGIKNERQMTDEFNRRSAASNQDRAGREKVIALERQQMQEKAQQDSKEQERDRTIRLATAMKGAWDERLKLAPNDMRAQNASSRLGTIISDLQNPGAAGAPFRSLNNYQQQLELYGSRSEQWKEAVENRMPAWMRPNLPNAPTAPGDMGFQPAGAKADASQRNVAQAAVAKLEEMSNSMQSLADEISKIKAEVNVR